MAVTLDQIVLLKQNEIKNIVEKEYKKLKDANDNPKYSWYKTVKYAESVNTDFLLTTDLTKWNALKAHFTSPTT